MLHAAREKTLRHRDADLVVRETDQHVDRRFRHVPRFDHRNANIAQSLTQRIRVRDARQQHAFGTAATEDVSVDVVQSCLGHASTSTTANYNKAGAHRRHREIAKLWCSRALRQRSVVSAFYGFGEARTDMQFSQRAMLASTCDRGSPRPKKRVAGDA